MLNLSDCYIIIYSDALRKKQHSHILGANELMIIMDITQAFDCRIV